LFFFHFYYIDDGLFFHQGVALQAAVLAGIEDENTKNFLLMEVIHSSLGIATGSSMSVLIKRNTVIPVHFSIDLRTPSY
jgi:molecular chaperone DnaK (HSP70)